MIYPILILSSFVTALISGVAGFGGALLLLPVVTMCVGAEVAVPVLTIAQLIGNASRMAFGFKQIRWRLVGYFSIGAIPLSILGAFGFSLLPKDIVTRCIGVAIIVIVLFKMIYKKPLVGGTKTLIIVGCVVGLLSGIAGSAGPIGAVIFLSLGLPHVSYIASEATTATSMHLVKSVVYGRLLNIDFYAVLTGIAMGAAMIDGTYLASRIIKNMSKDVFRKYASVLLSVVGLYMLVFGG